MLSLSSISTARAARPPMVSAPPPTGSVSVADFSRDRTLFDSGAAFGLDVADVPLAGTATPGQTVQARALSLDDGGASSTAWTDIGVADGAGNWSGTIAVGRSASWFRAEVRLKSAVSVTAQTANRFGVGHVIAIWGQSEPDRILSVFHDNTIPPPVADPEAVQILQGAAGNPTVSHISDSQPLTAAAAAMAGSLIAARPGEKFAIVFQTVPGTDPRQLVDDGDPARSWAADRALHDFATADGQHVGIAAMSWFASPGNLGAAYGEALFPLFAGKTVTGAPVAFPADITHSAGSYHADHWFGELYDYTRTKWVAYGPHRFDIDGDHDDATHYAGGAVDARQSNSEAARTSWRSMLALPDATMFLPLGLEPTTYVNGRDDGAGGWTDAAHPAGDTPDGAQLWARLTAHAILQAAGLESWQVPQFDNAYWEPSGAWVEVWSSAGPITTTRLKRGEPPLGTTFPHWTEVMGFQINGQPARNTQIVGGRVRIHPNSGSFSYADAIQFGEGGATGALKFPEDLIAGTWKNLPIVDLGLPDLDGVPLRPLADPAVLANTLPAGAPSFATGASGPYFYDPANLPAGTSAITYAGRFRFASLPGNSAILFAQASTGFDVELMNTGHLRLTIEDGTGAKMLSGEIVTTGLVTGVWHEIVVSADQLAQIARVNIEGVTVATLPFTASGNGQFQTVRRLSFLARNNGTLQFEGEVEHLRAWFEVTADGSQPVTPPYKEITGPAALANADPWKLGADAT